MSVESNFTKSDQWFRGEDKTLQFTITSDGTTAVDISGWSLQFILCNLDGTTVFTKDNVVSGGGINITNPTNGVLEVDIDDVDTDPLLVEKFKYELRRSDTGLEAVLAHGTAFIQQACT